MTVLTEGLHPAEAIMSEGPRMISRANLLIAASQTILANSLLGRTAIAAAVDVTQSFAGTGNGVLTLASPAFTTDVKDGNYRAELILAAANGGTFRVTDPDGISLGDVAVGVAWTKGVKFTIADGGTDFVLGDAFTITAAANAEDFEHGAYDPTATNGLQTPVAYAIYPATTGAGASARIAGIVRHAELNGNMIAWPAGITAAQKADALQALERRTIIVR